MPPKTGLRAGNVENALEEVLVAGGGIEPPTYGL